MVENTAMNFSFPPLPTWLEDQNYPLDSQEGREAYNAEYHRAYARWYRTQKVRINIYCSAEDREMLQTAARRHGRNLGAFVHEAALAYLQESFVVPDGGELQSLRLELRRIGTNINQVVTQVNRNGYVKPDDVEVLSERLRIMENAIVHTLTKPMRITEAAVKELYQNPELAESLRQALVRFDQGCL